MTIKVVYVSGLTLIGQLKIYRTTEYLHLNGKTIRAEGFEKQALILCDFISSLLLSASVANMAHKFHIGEIFIDFESLQSKIKLYQTQENVQLFKRDSRTVTHKSRPSNNKFNDRIKYYEITYNCKSWL